MLGDNIAALRKKQGMSQQVLADALFVTRQTISKWEKNISVPDADALVRLADALDTTVQSLLGQGEKGPTEPSDVAAALNRINDQLAIQNRRRSRIWKLVVWGIGLFIAFNALLMALSFALTAQLSGTVETQAVTMEESILIEDTE